MKSYCSRIRLDGSAHVRNMCASFDFLCVFRFQANQAHGSRPVPVVSSGRTRLLRAKRPAPRHQSPRGRDFHACPALHPRGRPSGLCGRVLPAARPPGLPVLRPGGLGRIAGPLSSYRLVPQEYLICPILPPVHCILSGRLRSLCSLRRKPSTASAPPAPAPLRSASTFGADTPPKSVPANHNALPLPTAVNRPRKEAEQVYPA